MAPRVTVCIVAYQSGPWLQPCVDALAAGSFTDFECVVADNASTDGSVAALRPPDARFRVEDMGANLGFAAANNRVARASGAALFACLNPDAQPEPGWLAALTAAADAHPGAAAFGSVQLRLEEPGVLDGLGDGWMLAGVAWRMGEGRPARDLPGDGEIAAPCGAATLYRRDAFLELGGFEERFFCYAEDVDLGLRLRRSGRPSRRASAAVVRHAGSAITGRRSDFTVYHGHRNRIWCWVRNTPGPWFWALLPLHLLIDAYLLVELTRTGSGPAIRRAYRDAWRGLGPHWRARRAAPAASFRALLSVSTLDPLASRRRAVTPR